MLSALIYAAFAVVAAFGIALGIVRRMIYPKGEIVTRTQRGHQFAANSAAFVLGAMLSRAIISGGDMNAIIAVFLLPSATGLLAFGIGWLLGPNNTKGDSKNAAKRAPHSTPTPTVPPFEMDAIYEQVADEIDNGAIQRGLWLRVYTECEGDPIKARASYIRNRAAILAKAHIKQTAETKRAATENTVDEGAAVLEALSSLTEEQLIERLCEQLLNGEIPTRTTLTIKAIQDRGVDADIIETLVMSRLGPEGTEKLGSCLSA